MSIDAESKIAETQALGSDRIDESLDMIGRACLTTVPHPPIGTDHEDLVQSVALAALQEGLDITDVGFTFAKNRAIDATKIVAKQSMPGNYAYLQTMAALGSGKTVEPSTNILGQAAQRRAMNAHNGVRNTEFRDHKDIFGVDEEDLTGPEFAEVEAKADGVLSRLLGVCHVTSYGPRANRNRSIVKLYLEGFSFPEIQEMYGVNSKTATAVWRNFFLQAKWYLEVMGIDEDTIRGNV